MNKMVITLPIAPYKNFSIGKLSTPILAEALAKKIDGKFYLAVNLLDSYKERNIDGYKELLDMYGLCSNHQLFQLYMVLMLENCFNKESKTIGLATPYINVENFGIEKELENRMLSLKLFTLFNFKWSKKENSIDIGLLKYLNSMNVEKKQQLYHLTIEENANNSIENIKDILIKDFNFQYANAELKRRRKNV